MAGWVRDDGAMRGVRLHETLQIETGTTAPNPNHCDDPRSADQHVPPEEVPSFLHLTVRVALILPLGASYSPARKSVCKGHLRVATATME